MWLIKKRDIDSQIIPLDLQLIDQSSMDSPSICDKALSFVTSIAFRVRTCEAISAFAMICHENVYKTGFYEHSLAKRAKISSPRSMVSSSAA